LLNFISVREQAVILRLGIVTFCLPNKISIVCCTLASKQNIIWSVRETWCTWQTAECPKYDIES